jgi:cell wall-associated NlpC family hydrolase
MGKKIIIVMMAIMLFISGCGDLRGAEPSPERNPGEQTALHKPADRAPIQGSYRTGQIRSLTVTVNQKALDDVDVFVRNKRVYVPLIQVLEFMDYRVQQKGNIIRAGFTDILFEVRQGSNQATVEGEPNTLSSKLITLNGQSFITTKDLQELFGPNTEVTIDNNTLSINTLEEDRIDYGFPEDVKSENISFINPDQPKDVPTLSSTTARKIISDARRFMGTPYVFGSRSGYTRTFDCSSFTQYIYYQNGIELPRVSRHQAKLGRYVPIEDLRPGDLLYFYWPGRFKSNEIVGHVGIYMGNGYMIHSAPDTYSTTDGVQITNIQDPDSPFREMYLGAKRLGQ